MNRAEKRRQQKIAKKAANKGQPLPLTSPTLDQTSVSIQRTVELAMQHHSAGDLQKAEGFYQQVLKSNPNHPVALHYLGVIAHQVGKNDTAVGLIGKALTIKPDYSEAHSNLGLILKEQGKLDAAATSYRTALSINPNYAEALHNLGIVLQEQNKLNDAIACYYKALSINSNNVDSHFNLGNALKAQGRLGDAIASYQKALSIKPDYVEAYCNVGIALQNQDKLDDAVVSYRKALAINPNYVEALSNLGNALQNQGDMDDAIASYRKAVIIKPDFTEAHSNLLLAEHYNLRNNAESLFKLHSEWNEQHGLKFQTVWQEHKNSPDPDRRLRIGFISPDLGQHPVGYFIVRLFENLTDEKIQTVVYSDRLADDLTDRIKKSTSLWRDIRGLPNTALIAAILDDEIDILFDLTGHSAGNRLLVFACKPAPIQVTWAGYVGTTGLTAIDYLISDQYSTRRDEEEFYSEKIVRMPDGWLCYDPPDYAPEVGPLPFEKNTYVTFVSFCNPAKINEEVVSVWARVLMGTINSRLLIKYKGINSKYNIKRLTSLFEAKGIDHSRLILEGQASHAEILARYNEVDIALDPFPYSGGLTTLEALWMGVPVITMQGQTFASRHSLSHLSTIGLPELIAKDKEEYVRLAIELAGNVKKMSELRAGIRTRMADSAICNGTKFADNFTNIMRKIWVDWCLLKN